MTQPPIDPELLARYAAGEASPEEAAAVRDWLAKHPVDSAFVASLDSTKLVGQRHIDVERALGRVKARTRGHSMRQVVTWAAAAAVLLVAGVLVARRPNASSTELVHVTGVGQRDSIRLADGSQVLLGPSSRISGRGRALVLDGEAYFIVAHDARRPFTVRAGDVLIRDIGTEFSVQRDSTEPLRVVVREGAVELVHRGDSVVLRPGDIGVVARGGQIDAQRGAAGPDDLAWTRGQLVFRNAPVPEVARDLRRWYGVELRVTDTALLGRHFTGSFTGESRQRVLDVIALALSARYELRGDTAYLTRTRPTR